jgi:phosphotransferase system HPr (HPr) family protein
LTSTSGPALSGLNESGRIAADPSNPLLRHVESTALKAVKVMNPQGFHARPAHLFVKLASQFQAEVEIVKGNEVINGKSILDLLTLGAGNGTTLTLRAIGPDAEDAVLALAQLVEGGFGENGAAP